ncbi:MAG: trehalase family glycosidase, partial [Bacteroidota bacterium]
YTMALMVRSSRFLFAVIVAFPLLPFAVAQQEQPLVRVHVRTTLDTLIEDEDTDLDTKITIEDPHLAGTERGDKRFWILVDGMKTHEVSGTYFLSNLLQELKLAEEAGLDSVTLRPDRIFEPPVDRISRMIREVYWDGLTRRIDEEGLMKTLSDEKTSTVDGYNYVYVSPSDKLAYNYFSKIAQSYPAAKIKVVQLPAKITPSHVRSIDGYHGILTLALTEENGRPKGVPFVVPGGRFNEMYGWDSYFIVLGLLQDDGVDLAKAMVDNFAYEITHYGKILNANRTYYLTRSQPPFLTSMMLAVYDRLPKDASSKGWLKEMLTAAIKEYYEVWMNASRLTKIGLSRYFDEGYGPPPEVEPGHFDDAYAVYAQKFGMDLKKFEEAYTSGAIKVPELDAYFVHDRAMRESGHDTSYRLVNRCADLVTVDLNSLLYKIELDVARTIENEFEGRLLQTGGKTERSSDWFERAEKRKTLINLYQWNEERGIFFDYDFVHDRQTEYVSATTFYPLWAGVASVEQAKALVKNALPLLEMPGGIVSSTEESRGLLSAERPPRQWDFPNGWAPHQMLVWQGLINYGYERIAHRLIYRWLHTITLNAAHYHGTVPEKFDLTTRSHQVFAEYGNVGTKFAYITREGFGWTNASFQVGLKLLPQEQRVSLNQLIPPEWVFVN